MKRLSAGGEAGTVPEEGEPGVLGGDQTLDSGEGDFGSGEPPYGQDQDLGGFDPPGRFGGLWFRVWGLAFGVWRI